MDASQFWNEVEIVSGGAHIRRASRRNETLVVFIHGLNGHWRKTWQFFAPSIMSDLGNNVDFFSFAYPAATFQSASYIVAAEDLAKELRKEYGHYRHLVFIVHSTGGLIIKQMLLNELRDKVYLNWQRVRQVINLGVPHHGGSAVGFVTYSVLSPIILPASAFLAFANRVLSFVNLAVPEPPLGVNLIAIQLTWGRNALKFLEKDYINAVCRRDDAMLPRPVSFDMIGYNDAAVDGPSSVSEPMTQLIAMITRSARKMASYLGCCRETPTGEVVAVDDRHALRVRGSHSSMKVPISNRDPSVKYTVSRINYLTTPFDSAVADASLQILNQFEALEATAPLIEPSCDQVARGYDEDARRTVEGSWLGNQWQVFDRTIKKFQENGNQWLCLLITGSAGVGKSKTIRALVRYWTLEWLKDDEQRSSLPIYLPIGSYALADSERKRLSITGDLKWQNLAAWWCNWLATERHRVLSSLGWVGQDERYEQIDGDMLTKRLTKPTILILDGIDDFFSCHPSLGYSFIDNLITQAQEFAGGHLQVILGTRSGIGRSSLVTSNNILEVATLSDSELRGVLSTFDLSRDRQESLMSGNGLNFSESSSRLLRTPLILQRILNRIAGQLQGEIGDQGTWNRWMKSMRSEGRLLDFSLRAEIQHGGLARIPDRRGHFHNEDEWINALTIVGHASFRNSWSIFEFDQMLVEVRNMVSSWEEHVGELDGDDAIEAKQFLVGASLAKDEDCLKKILTKTVFRCGAYYSFSHRVWEDFLAARHLAMSVKFSNTVEMGRRGSWTRMHYIIQDILRLREFSVDFVDRVHGLAIRSGLGTKEVAQIPIGNMLGVVGHSRQPLASDVLRRLLERYCGRPSCEIPPLVELVALNTLGYRMLRSDGGFDAIELQRRQFSDVVSKIYFEGEERVSNVITKMSASLILVVLNESLRQRIADAPLKYLQKVTETDEFVEASMDLIAVGVRSSKRLSALDKTMQSVLLEMQTEIALHADKSVVSMSYLFALAGVHLSHHAIPDVSEGLVRIVQSWGRRDAVRVSMAQSVGFTHIEPLMNFLAGRLAGSTI